MPELPQNQIPQIPGQSFLLSLEDLAAKQASWREYGCSEAEINELTGMLKSLSEMQDLLKDTVAKGDDDWWKAHPDEMEKMFKDSKTFAEKREEIGKKLKEIKERLGKTKQGENRLKEAMNERFKDLGLGDLISFPDETIDYFAHHPDKLSQDIRDKADPFRKQTK